MGKSTNVCMRLQYNKFDEVLDASSYKNKRVTCKRKSNRYGKKLKLKVGENNGQEDGQSGQFTKEAEENKKPADPRFWNRQFELWWSDR